MSDKINVVILAAGKGTRLKIDMAKPLVPCLGRPLVGHVVEALLQFESKTKSSLDIGVVVGHKKDELKAYLDQSFSHEFSYAHQKEQLGTGHALQTFFKTYPNAWDRPFTFILCADTPLITSKTYEVLMSNLKSKNLNALVASFKKKDPKGYGRIIKESMGLKIIEEKDADDNQRKIQEVNSGLYLMETSYIKKYLNSLDDKNESGEFYLTDLMKVEERVGSHVFGDASEFLGVNDLVQLDNAREILQKRINETHMRNGVMIINPSTVSIEPSVEIESGAIIYAHTELRGDSYIASEAIIESGCHIKNSKILTKAIIKSNSYLEGASIGENSQIGPMARIREGSNIASDCKIGNFVETKKSKLDQGVKVSHLSYVGDAEIGENTNIGCGFITCNYDGENKHQTIIGKNSFIGSDCQTVAPIEIGSSCFIGSGSTINKNVPDNAFAIARQKQVTKEDMAKRFLKQSKKS